MPFRQITNRLEGHARTCWVYKTVFLPLEVSLDSGDFCLLDRHVVANAAREGARLAASQSALDLASTGPSLPLSFGSDASPIKLELQALSVKAAGKGMQPKLDISAVLPSAATNFTRSEGIALALTDGQSVVGIGSALPTLYSNRWLGIPFSIVVAVLAYAAFHYLLYHTRAGTYVFALGGNREALILAGVPANRYHVFIYLLGGLMAGMGALLLTGRMSGGHPTAAIGMEFDAVVAVIIGGTKLERGDGWLPGSVLGVLTVGVLKNGLNVMAVPSSLQIASIGLLVIVALLMDSLRGNS